MDIWIQIPSIPLRQSFHHLLYQHLWTSTEEKKNWGKKTALSYLICKYKHQKMFLFFSPYLQLFQQYRLKVEDLIRAKCQYHLFQLSNKMPCLSKRMIENVYNKTFLPLLSLWNQFASNRRVWMQLQQKGVVFSSTQSRNLIYQTNLSFLL